MSSDSSVTVCHAGDMKVRYLTRCGRCREWMNPGTEASDEFGALWHTTCVLVYKQMRTALAASGRKV